jgi:hydrogenase maturation protease
MDLVVRAFDPCISCSVHMAEVRRAPGDDWKQKLANLKRTEPVFIGVGTEGRADDRAGLDLALELRKAGVKEVYLESELEEDYILESKAQRPFIFLDVVEMGKEPGQIALLPLQHVFWNSILSHRLLPAVSNRLSYEQVKNSYILGIQPESIGEGSKISPSVREAIEKILGEISN